MSEPSMFQEIVDFITPHVGQTNEREALIYSAFHDEPNLLKQINYEGSAATFAPSLVQRLRMYGTTVNGQQALWQLLLVLKGQLGLDKGETIESFREWANAPTSTEPKSSVKESPTPSFKEIKRKQAQEELKLKMAQYKSVSDSLMTSLDPSQTVKLQHMIERLDTEIQDLEKKLEGLE